MPRRAYALLRTLWVARKHPSGLLLAAQLGSLLLYPLMDGSLSGRVLFGAVALVVVPLTMLVVKRGPSVSWIGWLLAVPAIVLSIGSIVLDMPQLLVLSSLLESALYFYAAVGLIMYMTHDHRVTADELFAAGATFTLLAWGFAYAFFVCQAWYPGSFVGMTDPGRPRSWIELLSVSFSNLSATGLTDILPVSSQARVLVMLEQFAGVGYLATVVSRLIGLTIAHARERDPDDDSIW